MRRSAFRDDGGPAFPRPESPYGASQTGMSLRDYFAGQALAGMFASEGRGDLTWGDNADVAQHAYRVADAMLAQRERTK